MKRKGILLMFVFFAIYGFGNSKAIDFNRLPEKESIKSDYQKLLEYEAMVINWTPDWKYDTPKDTVSGFLESFYRKVCDVADKNKTNIEILLLKAILEHYQFNLDIGKFSETVGDTLKKARESDKSDYRPSWILANHLCKSAKPIEAWKEYKSVIDAFPYQKLSPYFWEDYAAFTLIARMPSNMIMATSFARELLGHPSDFERIFSKQIDNAFKKVSPDAELKDTEVWEVDRNEPGKQNLLLNRLFALSVSLDESWTDVEISGLSKGTSSFCLNLGPEKGLNDSEVYYTISLMMIATPGDIPLTEMTDKAFSKVKGYKKSDLSFVKKDAVVFEASSKTIYPEQGGSRTIAVALKRKKSQWPGTSLEKPLVVKTAGGGDQVKYFEVTSPNPRLAAPIIYLILLDTCEAAYERSLKVFTDFVNNRLVIE
jgi:hypothetical protein